MLVNIKLAELNFDGSALNSIHNLKLCIEIKNISVLRCIYNCFIIAL